MVTGKGKKWRKNLYAGDQTKNPTRGQEQMEGLADKTMHERRLAYLAGRMGHKDLVVANKSVEGTVDLDRKALALSSSYPWMIFDAYMLARHS